MKKTTKLTMFVLALGLALSLGACSILSNDSSSETSQDTTSSSPIVDDSSEKPSSHTVTFVDGSTKEKITVESGKTATAPAWTKAGYDLSWDKDLTAAITQNTTFTAVWAARTDTPYSVEVYLEALDGSMTNVTDTIAETLTKKTGTTDATADITDEATAQLSSNATLAKYVLNEEKSELTGTIAGDGTLVLKIVYSVKAMKVTFKDGETTETVSVLEGDTATAPAWTKAGYELSWDQDVTAAITTDTVFTAKWTPRTDTQYTIEVWIEDKNVSDQLSSEFTQRKGTTEATVDLASEVETLLQSESFAYCSLNATESVLTGTIAGDGSLVLKIVLDYDEFAAARTGDDENTVFFFDNELGLKQLGNTEGLSSVSYTTDMAYGNEEGALKLVCDGTATQPNVSYDKMGYEFNDGDLLVFRVYYESGSTVAMQMMLNYSEGQRVMQNVWTTIVMPASVLDAKDHFRFWTIDDVTLSGTVYISKIKAYSADEVVNLGAVADDYEYTVGDTTFVGKAGGNICGDTNTTLSATYAKNAIYVDGEVQVTFTGVEDSQLILNLKDAVDVSTGNVYMAITMRDLEDLEENLYLYPNESTAITWEIAKVTDPDDDGYVTVVIKLIKTADQNLTKIRLDWQVEILRRHAVTFCISDVKIGDYEAMVEEGYLPARTGHEVTFTGGEGYSQTVEVKDGDYVTAPAWTKAGYDLSWDQDVTATITADTVFTAIWTPRTDTKYSVEVWLDSENISDSLDSSLTERTGTTGESVDLTDEANAILSSDSNLKYYRLDSSSVLSGTIAGDGTLVLKIVYAYDEFLEARTGEDANTILFYDRAIGAELQTGNTESLTYGYTTEKAWANEEGSLKIVTNASSQSALYFNAHSMEWSAGDYVSFYVYSEKDIRMALLFAYTAGVELVPNAWTKVTVSAEAFFAGHFRFYQHKSTNSVSDSESVTLYMSKVVLISGDDVKDLTVAGTTYTLGELEFSATGYNNGKDTNSVFNDKKISDAIYRKPMLIDGELVVTYFATNAAQLILTVADGVEVAANEEVLITVEMYDYGRLSNLSGYFNESGKYPMSFVSATPTENGYANVVFRCGAKTEAYTLTSIRIDAESFESNQMNAQFRIKSVSVETNSIADLRTGDDENTVFFFDSELGLKQLGKTEGLSVAYTTEKAYGDEAGSVKLVCDGTATQPNVSYDKMGYEFNDGDLLVFRVYYEGGNADAIQIMFNWSEGQRIMPNVWTTIVVPASVLDAKDHFRFWSIGDTALGGTIYVSKIKAYAASEVVNLGAVADDYEYTLGDTTFVGKASGNICGDSNSTLSKTYAKNAIYVDGEVQATFVGVSDSQLILTLKNAVSVSENDVYMAVTMRNFSGIDKLCLFANALTAIATEIVETTAPNEEGYVTVVFKLSKTADQSVTSIRLDYEDTLYNTQAVTLCISDVEFGDYEAGAEETVNDIPCAYSAVSAEAEEYADIVSYGATAVTLLTAEEAKTKNIPEGYEDNVLVVEGGVDRGVLLDFSAYGIPTADIESITFRVYVGENGTTTDNYPEVRILQPYLKGWVMRYDISKQTDQWVDITLGADGTNMYDVESLDGLGVDGVLARFELAIRNKGTDAAFYIDSIVIQRKTTA